MDVTTARETVNEMGPLTRIVLQYAEMIESRACAAGTAIDWEPLTKLVAVDEFKRVGAYQEEMNWQEYIRFLTEWAGSTRFEATVFHITEVGRRVFQEIEERHYRGDDFIRKNVIAVYLFDEQNRIRHLDIYEQARDSGRWIVEAAREAVSS
ncbi:MAG TPA: hypothetical protein VIK82_06060 [Porticoccaceae bacterium]